MKVTLANGAAPLLITTMLLTAPAWAQTSATPPPAAPGSEAPATGAPGHMSGMPSGTMQKGMPSSHQAASRQPGESMESAVERRITDLHSRLRITSQQGQQWDQFAQTMRDNAKDLDQKYQERSQGLGSMSAVDSMKTFADIEQLRAQDMEKLVPSFQSLYDSMSDQQKKTADQVFRNFAANAPRPQAARAQTQQTQ